MLPAPYPQGIFTVLSKYVNTGTVSTGERAQAVLNETMLCCLLLSQQIGSVHTACLAMKLLPRDCKLLQKKLTLSTVSVKAKEKALAPTAHPNYSPSGNAAPWGGETLLLPGM